MTAAVLEESFELWQADAVATIIGLAKSQELITADDLRPEMRTPPVANWAGLAFKEAKRLGHIESVETTTSKARSRNCGSLKKWRRKINEGVAAK